MIFNSILKKVNTKNGMGIVSSTIIPPHSVIYEFKGNILSRDQLDLNSPYYLQIDLNKFMGASGDFDDYINHSCNPNAGLYIINNRAFLYSIYQINVGNEIVFDYSTSSNLEMDEWKISCNCGSFNCRKVISGWQYLSENTKKYYLNLGYVAKFLR